MFTAIPFSFWLVLAGTVAAAVGSSVYFAKIMLDKLSKGKRDGESDKKGQGEVSGK